MSDSLQQSEYVPHPAEKNATAYILTGGRSQRMGQDKALLHLPSGITLLEHAVATASAVVSDVHILGPRERYAQFAWAGKIVEDIYPACGPLAGIHAALCDTSTEWNLIVAVDMPNVSVDLLRWLLSEAHKTGKQVTVTSCEKQIQPLCGIYRRNFVSVAEAALESGKNKVAASFVPSETRIISEEELRFAGFSPVLLANLNTPEEFRNAFSR